MCNWKASATLFDSNGLESAPDSNAGCLDVTGGQQFVDDSERHHSIRPLGRVRRNCCRAVSPCSAGKIVTLARQICRAALENGSQARQRILTWMLGATGDDVLDESRLQTGFQ